MPAIAVRIRTSRLPGLLSPTSSMVKGWLTACNTAAFMMFFSLGRYGFGNVGPEIEFLGDPAVILEHGRRVERGEFEHAHILVSGTDARSPKADILDGRHDTAEEPGAELPHHLGFHHDLGAFLGRKPEAFPHFELIEPVAHVIA